ncbi:hypothetical protein [Nonomuraea aridisoli]|nr:hypothetical protein [Nonomuraea aridisoli]
MATPGVLRVAQHMPIRAVRRSTTSPYPWVLHAAAEPACFA